jgi:hypothetical protein
MPWNSTWPLGTSSVKGNRTRGQQNTTYIEETLGNQPIGSQPPAPAKVADHFWDIDADHDGRHRFVQSPGFTVGGNPDDPTLGTQMDGCIYLKEVNSDVGRVEGFYRNTQGIYQFIPSFISGSVVLNGSNFVNIEALPPNVYGEIFLYRTSSGRGQGQMGFFKTDATICDAWSYGLRLQGDSTAKYNIRLANGSDADGLNLRAILDFSNNTNWNYRITYRAI